MTESLKDTADRTLPYFESEIRPRMISKQRILVVAHGNSLRALIKEFDHLSDNEIIDVNIPTGVPLIYNFDADFNVISKHYLTK